MRKKILVLSMGFALFAFTAFAQTSRSTSQSGANQSSDVTAGQQSDSNQTGGMSDQSTQAQPSMPQSGTNTPGTSSQSAADQNGAVPASNDATMEGCIVSQGSDYFLQSPNGAPIRLQGPDIASYVGQQVRVHGAEANGANTAAGADNGMNASGSLGSNNSASNSQSQSTSPAYPNAGSGSVSDNSSASSDSSVPQAPAFQVDRVEILSTTCQASDINQNQSNPDQQQPGPQHGQPSPPDQRPQ
jgi:hypothetical protein